MSSEAAPVIPDGAEQPDLPDLESYAPYIGSVTVQGHDEAGEAAEPARQAADDSSPDLPALETPLAESDATRAKRGRRGGRRRRKPGDEAEAAFEPPPPQAYLGPTPADPFALGAMDIFDALEQAQQRPPAPADTEDKASATDTHQDNAAPQPDPEPTGAPAIKPVLIGTGDAVVLERKKGWWRR